MYSLETIKDMNRKAAKKAVGRQPWVAAKDGDENVKTIPDFGDYRPKDWKLVEEHFVDSSGCGGYDEPALTFNQFLKEVKEGRGYAIIEQGQFQIYVGEFVRK